MCVCVCCNALKTGNHTYLALPNSEVKSLLASQSFPGTGAQNVGDDALVRTLNENITPPLKKLFFDSFGFAYEGDATKPTGASATNVDKLSCIEALKNFSKLPIGNYDKVAKCMDTQFTNLDTLGSDAISKVVNDSVQSASKLFEDAPLYEWKSHVFNSSINKSDSNATQETRAVTWFAHAQDESGTTQEKVCILYYVAVTWESKK